jgi:ribosomal protein S18 acetylase RimI-like enzyme
MEGASGVTVRRATEDDAPAIASVLRDAFAPYRPHYTADAFAATVPPADAIRRRLEEGPVWVALRGDVVVGTVAAVLKDGGAYVRGMAVARQARGRGLGAQLLEAVERLAREHGVPRLFLSTTPFLGEAIRLYERQGFRRTHDGPRTLCGTPLFTMEKVIRPDEPRQDCCADTPAVASAPWRCPRSGSPGKAVGRRTVTALLADHALVRLSPGDYRYCPDPHCEVVYFGADGVCFTTDDLRVAVWQKQPFGNRVVCYCLGESETSLRAEIAAHGRSSALDRIRAHVAAKQCACDVRNPRGSCCLGDVTAAIERVTREGSP